MMVWGLIDDRPGHANQVRGLVEALGLPHLFHTLSYNALSHLPNLLLGASICHLAHEARNTLCAPWPTLVIASGRRTEPVARWIKKQNPTTRIVYIMTPASLKRWDAVIIPLHDSPPTTHHSSPILTTHGPLHRITPDALATARGAWGMRFTALPSPRIGVLMGNVSIGDAEAMLARATALAGDSGSILITSSRRTKAGLLASLVPSITPPHYVFDWHAPSGENPYLGILASSDRLIVSGDSLSMCVEAVASGAPTHIASWPSLPAKHRALHQMLIAHGHALHLEDEGSTTTPTNDTLYVAEALRNRFLL